jgi:hypothetical protein
VTTLGGAGANAMQLHPGPFNAARDSLLEQLRRAIDGKNGSEPSEAAKEFLGYAPVLEAISVLLAGDGNPSRLREELEGAVAQVGGEDRHAPARLLAGVVQKILEREQREKLVPHVKPVLAQSARTLGWTAWDALYGPDEQCKRLIGCICSSKATVDLDMPPALRPVYEDQVAILLPEHPFLRDAAEAANVVFESYLFALATVKDYTEAGRVLHRTLSDPAFKPSRLFADFYLLFREQDGGGLVPVEHIGWLYDSVLSAESGALTVHLSVDGPEPADSESSGELTDIEVEFELWFPDRADGSPSKDRLLNCLTRVTPSDTLAFTRYVRDASITVPCGVALGTPDHEFEIGPAVTISCRELLIRASGLIVGGRARQRQGNGENYDPAVIVEALGLKGMLTRRPEVRVPFRVSWPGAAVYPWTDFHTPVSAALGTDRDLREVYRRFRRIVMTLRSHKKGGLARCKDKIDHARVLQGPMGEALLDRMVSDGILRLEEDFYHWAPDRASALVGTTWLDLRGNQASPLLTDYLRNFLTTFNAGR